MKDAGVLGFGPADIAACIPHQGRMCLLEQVVAHDAEHMRCVTRTHTQPDHPLREAGRLGAVAAIEYAAQAMALHSALSNAAAERAQSGFLASVRDVQMAVSRLDDVAVPLDVRVDRLAADAQTALYRFEVCAEGRVLVQGRLSAVLDAAAHGV